VLIGYRFLSCCHRRYTEGFKPNFQDHLKPVLATIGKVLVHLRLCACCLPRTMSVECYVGPS
jgi:hypothetical protein